MLITVSPDSFMRVPPYAARALIQNSICRIQLYWTFLYIIVVFLVGAVERTLLYSFFLVENYWEPKVAWKLIT